MARKPMRLIPSSPTKRFREFYHDWDAALARLEELPPERLDEGVEGLLARYAEDAILESPLIPHLIGTERGICRGHEEMRRFLREVGRRKPSVRKYYRRGFFTDGKKVDLGISPSKAGWRANGFRGINRTEPSRSDSTPRRLLGVARSECNADGRGQALMRRDERSSREK